MVHLKDAQGLCPGRLPAGKGIVARSQEDVLPGADGRGPLQRRFGKGSAAQGRGGELAVHHMGQSLLRRSLKVRREKGDALHQISGHLPVLLIRQEPPCQAVVKDLDAIGLRVVCPGKQAHARCHACVVHFNHLAMVYIPAANGIQALKK